MTAQLTLGDLGRASDGPIGNVTDLLSAMRRKFPRAAVELEEWAPNYHQRLAKLSPAELRETLDHTLAGWTLHRPPRPAELILPGEKRSTSGRAEATDIRRSPLYVEPPKAFAAMTDRERETWQRENGALFLVRLGYLKRMAPHIGEAEAARMLLAAHDEDAIYHVWDEWRRRQWPERYPLPLSELMHGE